MAPMTSTAQLARVDSQQSGSSFGFLVQQKCLTFVICMQKIMRHIAGWLTRVILLIYVRSVIAPGHTACGARSCRGCGSFGFKFMRCSLNW
jgi:hypothetical protein